jgi:hypothetical protein
MSKSVAIGNSAVILSNAKDLTGPLCVRDSSLRSE